MVNIIRYIVAFIIFMMSRYTLVQISLGKSINLKEAVIKSAFFALALYLADTYMPPKKTNDDEIYLG